VLDAREQRRAAADATWFDVISAAGMLAFKAAAVEWAVVEVGLGGRLDSTNVLDAPVVVVTNIALEHAEIIGPTLRDIAREKAGIIARASQPIVGMAASHDLASVFADEAAAVGARPPLFVPPLPGAPLAAHNTALARCALRSALPHADADALLPDRLAAAVLSSLPGRMERFCVRVADLDTSGGGGGGGTAGGATLDVTLDGAHVADSVRRVLLEVQAWNGAPPAVLLALGREKDAAAICREIAAVAAPRSLTVTQVSPEDPYMPADELQAIAAAAGAAGVQACASPDVALGRAARSASVSGTHLVVIGSLHLAGRVRPALAAASVAGDRGAAA
jgi:dihydrofolate synthase / folylpolyglutamate synthase